MLQAAAAGVCSCTGRLDAVWHGNPAYRCVDAVVSVKKSFTLEEGKSTIETGTSLTSWPI